LYRVVYIDRAEPVLFIGEYGARQNLSPQRPVRGRMPPEATRPPHHCGWAGE
jgi:hypothetical protein